MVRAVLNDFLILLTGLPFHSRIGAGRRLQLASHGIETAADITEQRVMAVSGIGLAIARDLVSWRRSLESNFVFNPSILVDPTEIARVKQQVASERATKVGEARRLINALDQVVVEIQAPLDTKWLTGFVSFLEASGV